MGYARVQANSEQGGRQSLQAAELKLRVADDANSDSDGGASQPARDDAEVTAMDVVTTSTNTSDDYTHRGLRLQSMPFYVYRMYVMRVRKQGRSQACGSSFFEFERHYPLAGSYVQKLNLNSIQIPTIDGYSRV